MTSSLLVCSAYARTSSFPLYIQSYALTHANTSSGFHNPQRHRKMWGKIVDRYRWRSPSSARTGHGVRQFVPAPGTFIPGVPRDDRALSRRRQGQVCGQPPGGARALRMWQHACVRLRVSALYVDGKSMVCEELSIDSTAKECRVGEGGREGGREGGGRARAIEGGTGERGAQHGPEDFDLFVRFQSFQKFFKLRCSVRNTIVFCWSNFSF